MEPISQSETANTPFSFDDDGFFLGVANNIPQLRPRQTEPEREMVVEAMPVEVAAIVDSPAIAEVPAATVVEAVSQEPVSEEAAPEVASAPMTAQIPDKLYFRIGDVADLAGVKPYVLRYWESEFPMISPEKSSTGQRVYRRTDVEMILLIKHLLYQEKYSIEGARKRIQEVRRDGQLKAFKQDKVYGGHEAAVMRERQKLAVPLLTELESLARVPIRELFRY